MATLKRALMNPMPTLAVALKWVASTTSIVSTPGPHGPTCSGSMTNAQTFSRDALIGTEPSKCMRALRGRCGIGPGQSPDDTDAWTYAVGSRMKLVRQPIEQNA